MRRIIVFLMLAAMASAAFDQSYVQTVANDGSSVIVKTQDLSPFSGIVSIPALQKACAQMSSVQCSVDGQVMAITERFSSGTEYYSFVTENGFPSITYTLTVNKIPNDVFSADIDRVMVMANASPGSQPGPAIDLSADNRESAAVLRLVKANVTYTVVLPVTPGEASAGNASGRIEGSRVTFNLVDVFDASRPIVIKASALNAGIIVLIVGAVVLAWLAYSFFGISRKKQKPASALKRKKTK
jgi:hypothetical protein